MKYCMAILLILISFNTYAQLIKWVDANGKVHYSDSPPPDEVKTQALHISTSPAAPSSGPAAAKTIAEQEADLKKAQKAKLEAAQKEAKAQEDTRIKQSNCAQARTQLSTMQNSPRVASYDANGERSIMDDATRQQKIQDAQKAISDYCN